MVSRQPCSCHSSLDISDGKRANFFSENFIPDGYRLYYTSMSTRKHMYMAGKCRRCFGLLEEPIPLPKDLSGDDELERIYKVFMSAHPYDQKDERIGYYGPLKERTDYYKRRDEKPLFLRNKAFLDLFHDYDRAQVRRWLEKQFPPQAHEEVFRDTGGDLFSTAVRMARENGDMDKAEQILDYILPRASETSLNECVYLTSYEFDFVPIVDFGSSEGIYLCCYLRGKFDDSGRSWIRVGTMKTLSRSLEAAKIMSELGGALMYHADRYVNANLHRYTPDEQLKREAQRKAAMCPAE